MIDVFCVNAPKFEDTLIINHSGRISIWPTHAAPSLYTYSFIFPFCSYLMLPDLPWLNRTVLSTWICQPVPAVWVVSKQGGCVSCRPLLHQFYQYVVHHFLSLLLAEFGTNALYLFVNTGIPMYNAMFPPQHTKSQEIHILHLILLKWHY